jgi:hypothetical protein
MVLGHLGQDWLLPEMLAPGKVGHSYIYFVCRVRPNSSCGFFLGMKFFFSAVENVTTESPDHIRYLPKGK